MNDRLTYGELEHRVRELEQIQFDCAREKAALYESEKRYRSFFENAVEGFFQTTPEGRFLNANSFLASILGYDSPQQLMETLTNIGEQHYVDPLDRERFVKTLEQKGILRDFETRLLKKDGSAMWASLSARTVRDEGGFTLYYEGTMSDITRRKRTEEALKQSEERYKTIVSSMSDLIFVIDEEERLIDIHCQSTENLLLPPEEFLGKSIDEVLPSNVNDLYRETAKHVRLSGENRRYEYSLPIKGEKRWFVACLDLHTDGRKIVAGIRDITERKQAEKALRKSLERIRLFAYSVSHDLKSPATAIHGLTRRLQSSFAHKLGEKGKAYCDQIVKGAEHISALVQQINDYISTSNAALTIERVELKDLLQMVREEFSDQLNTRQITWSQPEHNAELDADIIAIRRILRNLVDNALKYGGDNFRELRIDHAETDISHIISVSNNGSMIKPEYLEEIFGPFQRHENAKGVEGSGLGLAIVKELAELHGGNAWVESLEKEWTTFHVSISKYFEKDKYPEETS